MSASVAHHTHPFPPLYDKSSRILILGSFPSVKSREVSFFYGHPQNRFWRILSALYEEPLPLDIPQKRAFLYRHGIALWDVIGACEICGSSDASIRNAVPNDLSRILKESAITRIFTNGRTAERTYRLYQEKVLGIPATPLPSSSPANAAFSLSDLIEAWRVIL